PPLYPLSLHDALPISTTPDKYRETSDIDAFVFDRFAPPTAPSKPALIVGAAAVDWLRALQGEVRKPSITTWADDHPLMQYVPVQDRKSTRLNSSHLGI